MSVFTESFTDMQRQFVAVAARTIHDSAPTPEWWRNRDGGEEAFRLLRTGGVPDDTDWAVAGYLLGAVETANATSLEKIVQAAYEYEVAVPDERPGVFETALFRAITLESLGVGKVADEFGEVVISAHRCGCASDVPMPYSSCCESRPLTVPRLAIEGSS